MKFEIIDTEDTMILFFNSNNEFLLAYFLDQIKFNDQEQFGKAECPSVFWTQCKVK